MAGATWTATTRSCGCWPLPRSRLLPPSRAVEPGACAGVVAAVICWDVAARTAVAGAAVAGAAGWAAEAACGSGTGCRVGSACAAAADWLDAGLGAAVVAGVTRGTTTGFGFAAGCRRSTGAARNPTAGTTWRSGLAAGGVGRVAAWTSAGWIPAGKAAKDGVWPPEGPARNRGIAAAAATAPASKTAATIRSIELMFPTPDADYITRTRYRHHRAGA